MLLARPAPDRRRPSVGPVSVVAVPLVLAALVACTPGATSSDEGDGGAPATEQPAQTVTIPPVRLTPFCQAMIDLAERLETDPPDDVEAEIIATYEQIEADVPDEIREDFDAVLADLRGERRMAETSDTADPPITTPTPTPTDESGAAVAPGDPFFDEGYTPEDDPAARLNAYVDFECRDVANNPGPPPTQPLSEPTTTDG